MLRLSRPGVLLALLACAPASSHAIAAPGDLVAFLPTNFSAPQDIAFDPSDGTFWVTSFLEEEVFHFSGDLRERIGTIPVPFDSFLFPFTTGIALDTRRGTLLLTDGFQGQIHEVGRDGTPTGTVIDIPFIRETNNTPGALAFHAAGDGGRGSLYLIENGDGLFYEIDLDGRLIRTFPDVDDPDRWLGLGKIAHPFAFDLVVEDGALRGFLAASATAGLLELDADGRFTGRWTSLDHAGGQPSAIIRRVLPDPRTGAPRDLLLCIVGTEARLAFLEPGFGTFDRVTRFRCESDGGSVLAQWSSWRPFDGIDVLDGCEVIDRLPGDATSWRGVLEPGVHELSVRATTPTDSTASDRCTIVVGAGEVLREIELPEGRSAIDLAAVGDGRVLVSDSRRREVHVLSPDLELLESLPVSEFFATADDTIGPIAFDGATQTLFLFNHTKNVIGLFDFPGLELVDTLDVLLPDLDRPRRFRPWIQAMTFRPGERPGTGTFLMTEVVHDRILEVDLAGIVRREIPHPYHDLEDLPDDAPIGPRTGGIALVEGSAGREVFFAGGLLLDRRPIDIFRLDLETGEPVPGSHIPTDALGGARGLLHVAGAGGAGRLYVAGSRTVFEASAGLPDTPSPRFVECAAIEGGAVVEITFEPAVPYDAIEVSRDCELVATLDGTATRFVDRSAPPGVREYAVRGRRDAIWSDDARCSLRVGTGAVVARSLTWPVESPRLLARDAEDGALFVTGRLYILEEERLSDEMVHRFDSDFTHIEARPAPLEPPAQMQAITVRRAGRERLLYFIMQDAGGFSVLATADDGEFVDQFPLDPPLPSPPFPAAPVGLTWIPSSDTFFYLERHGGNWVELDASGTQLRVLRHPFPPPNHFFLNTAAAFSVERGAILAPTISEPADLHVGMTRLVEIDLDGRLTGVDIPLDPDLTFRAIATDGDEVILVTRSPFHEFVVLQGPVPGTGPGDGFIRGDANGNLVIEIADPIFLLNNLFRAGRSPPCPDAADADDDGRLNITDAIRVLSYLFLAGPPPPEPFPERGADPTPDELDC